MLLDKLKDAPGAVDGDRMEGKMGSIADCGRLTFVDPSRKLATGVN